MLLAVVSMLHCVCVCVCRVHVEVRVSHTHKEGVAFLRNASLAGSEGEESGVKREGRESKNTETMTRPQGSTKFKDVTHNITAPAAPPPLPKSLSLSLIPSLHYHTPTSWLCVY